MSTTDESFTHSHAERYAIRQGLSDEQAEAYTDWYVAEYPDGDASHADKLWYWLDQHYHAASVKARS